MEKLDPAVRRETVYMAVSVLVYSLIMEAVFLILGKWNLTVLFGNLLGGAVAILNFFLMALTVQKAVTLDEKEARKKVKTSMSLRSLMILVIAGIGLILPCFHTVAVIVPLLFVRIAVFFRRFFAKNIDNIR